MSSTSTTANRPRRLRICLSIDFDAISGYLGTGHTPSNTLSDYSAGILSANVGVPRLLKLLRKYSIADKVTWFIPGHTMETFPAQTADIVASGAEIALHGYSHEGAHDMTTEQERDVLEKCIDLATTLLNHKKKPVGYRAPLYQIRESTISLLQSHNFLYDSSMNAHDSLPYFLIHPFPQSPTIASHVPDYSQPAESWMNPTILPPQSLTDASEIKNSLVEIPTSWYTEDMTPLGHYPYTPSTQGYVSVDIVEKIWWDRFEWIWENESFITPQEFSTSEQTQTSYGSIFPLIWHPESAGRAHIIGMIERFIKRLVEKMEDEQKGEITFETMENVATSWRDFHMK